MRFVDRVTLKVYLERGESTELEATADGAGKSASQYVRQLIQKDLGVSGGISESARKPRVAVPAGSLEVRAPDVPAVTSSGAPLGTESLGHQISRVAVETSGGEAKRGYCLHGVKRGYRCWQCGGLAKIGGAEPEEPKKKGFKR